MTFRPFLPGEHALDVSHVWEDDGAGGGIVHSTQNVAPLLERNKAMRLHNDGYTKDRTLRRVAFIPNIIRNKWLNEEGWDAYRPDLYGDKLAQKLNDPDWAYLRTADGRVAHSNGAIR